MSAFLEILQMALLTLVAVILNPFFWLVIFLVYLQYKRMDQMRIQVIGKSTKSIKEMILRSTIAGVMGGIAGTFIMSFIGITIHIKDFYYVLPLAILLMLINIRYICFSYSGGLLALSSLVIGFPHLDVSGIMAIVGILHLIESILIYFDGYKDAVPIFLEDKKYGVVGGFSLQRFWPIPFVVLIIASGILEGAREVNLPDWWPIFRGNMDLENVSLQMATVVAALGYGDISLSSTPKDKCRVSSRRLFLYSAILLLLAILSTKIYIFKWVAAIFSPVGHEYLIIYAQKEEKRKTPIFRRHSRGVTVLDIIEEGVGYQMGLKPSDVIVKMNSHWINHQEELKEILKEYPPYIWMEVIEASGKIKTLEYKDYQRGINSLDTLLVPVDTQFVFDAQTSSCILKKLIKKIKKIANKK